MLGPSRTVDGTSKTRYPLDTQGGHRERVWKIPKRNYGRWKEQEKGKQREWRYIHFHVLKFLSLALSAEEGGGAVLDEPGLAFAETSDIGRNKVLGGNTLGRTLFGRGRSSGGGTLGGDDTRRRAHSETDPRGLLQDLWLRGRRDWCGRAVKDLVSGNAHLLVRVRVVGTESAAEHHCSRDGRVLLRARAHGMRRSGGEGILEFETEAVEGGGGFEAGVIPVSGSGGEEGGVVGKDVCHVHVERRDNVHGGD